MKLVLKIFAILLVGMCMTGVALALTVLRPRIQVERTPVKDNPNYFCGFGLSRLSKKELERYVARGQRRSFFQWTSQWKLVPVWRWHRDDYKQDDASNLFSGHSGWTYGPFSYEERTDYFAWPKLVEESARATLSRKSWGKDAALAFTDSNKWVRDMRLWHVVASNSSGENLKMDFYDDGTPFNPHVGK